MAMKPCSVVPGLPKMYVTPSAISCSRSARLPVSRGTSAERINFCATDRCGTQGANSVRRGDLQPDRQPRQNDLSECPSRVLCGALMTAAREWSPRGSAHRVPAATPRRSGPASTPLLGTVCQRTRQTTRDPRQGPQVRRALPLLADARQRRDHAVRGVATALEDLLEILTFNSLIFEQSRGQRVEHVTVANQDVFCLKHARLDERPNLGIDGFRHPLRVGPRLTLSSKKIARIALSER